MWWDADFDETGERVEAVLAAVHGQSEEGDEQFFGYVEVYEVPGQDC